MNEDEKQTARFFNPVRLVAGLAVLALLLVPAYFFVIREPADPNVRLARLLETRSDAGLEVGLDVGHVAPDFEFSTPDGERIRLSELRGRPLVVNFWATWCTSCLTEMPDLKALQEKKGLDTFNVLAVNAGETRPRAEEFIDFLQAPFVYGMDPGLVLSDAYGVYGLPLSVFLDAGGVVRGVYRGHARADVLDTFVTAAIEARPAGEIPVVLRTVYGIPRERVLTVSTDGPGNLSFTSRSLRCDLSYCAEDTLRPALDGLSGVTRATFSGTDGDIPSLRIDFDPALLRDDEVVAALTDLLQSIEDPVYDRPLEVRFRSAVSE